MGIAHVFVEETLVPEIEFRAALRGLERNRYERLALGRRARPRPSEDERAVRHYLLVDAGAFVLAALRAAEDDAKAPADPHVELRERDRLARRRAPPLLQRFGVRPRAPDLFRRDRVVSIEDEEGFFSDPGLFHVCSSSCW